MASTAPGLIQFFKDQRPNITAQGYVDLPFTVHDMAMNRDGDRFGRENVEKLLLEVQDRSANEALNHILWTIRQHTGPRRATDDTTLILIKRD